MTTEATCQHCGKSFTRPAHGREPKFCCPAHRQAAWQARRPPTMSQERSETGQAASLARAELEALRDLVTALGERVERLEAGAGGAIPPGAPGESSPPAVTKADDRPARARTSRKPWAVIRTPTDDPSHVAWVYTHHTTELAATRQRDRLARQGQDRPDAGHWRWAVVEDRAGALVPVDQRGEDDHA